MVLCVLGISVNQHGDVIRKQFFNATPKLIDPTVYIALQRDHHTQIYLVIFAMSYISQIYREWSRYDALYFLKLKDHISSYMRVHLLDFLKQINSFTTK